MAKSKNNKSTQRLDKSVAHLTGLSRQMATRLIKDGGVQVDGIVVYEASSKVSLDSAICISGFNDDYEDMSILAQDNESTAHSAKNVEVMTLESRNTCASKSQNQTGVDHFATAFNTELSTALTISQSTPKKDFTKSKGTSVKDAFKKRVFLLNKPHDFICADRDKNHRLVVSLFRQELKNDKLHCAGRLDVDTTGVLIVTDDGDLNHEITSPKKKVSKLYYAKLNQAIPESAVRLFANGIKHKEEKKRYQGAKLFIINNGESSLDSPSEVNEVETNSEHLHIQSNTVLNNTYTACVQLTEGRYHEVKRMFESVGCEVIELARLAIGKLCLPSNFKLGEYKLLTDEEIELLFSEQDYSQAELIKLVQIYEQNIASSPLIYLPQAYKERALQNKASVQDQDSTTALASGGISALTSDSSIVEEDVIEDVLDDCTDDFMEDEQDFDELDADGNLRIY